MMILKFHKLQRFHQMVKLKPLSITTNYQYNNQSYAFTNTQVMPLTKLCLNYKYPNQCNLSLMVSSTAQSNYMASIIIIKAGTSLQYTMSHDSHQMQLTVASVPLSSF